MSCSECKALIAVSGGLVGAAVGLWGANQAEAYLLKRNCTVKYSWDVWNSVAGLFLGAVAGAAGALVLVGKMSGGGRSVAGK